MKKVASSLILGILLVTGCSSNDSTSPSKSSSVSASATRNIIIDRAYIKTVRSKVPSAQSRSDEQLIQLGEFSCERFRLGDTLFEIIDSVTLQGFTEEESAYIIGAGWAAYCPKRGT